MRIAIFSSLLFLLAGCTQMYVPNMQNVPQFQEKNQVNLSATPQNVQFAWAFSENLGLMANYFRRTQSFESDNNEIKTTNTLFEGGTGYHEYFEDDGLTLSAFGGIGMGNSDYTESTPNPDDQKFNTDLFRFFLQGSIGMIAGEDNVNLAFTMRYANLAFSNIDTTKFLPQDLSNNNIADLEKTNFNFLEPGLTFRAGFKYIKLHSQLIYSSKLDEQNLNYYPLNLNIGITLNLKAIHDKLTGKEALEEEKEP